MKTSHNAQKSVTTYIELALIEDFQKALSILNYETREEWARDVIREEIIGINKDYPKIGSHLKQKVFKIWISEVAIEQLDFVIKNRFTSRTEWFRTMMHKTILTAKEVQKKTNKEGRAP